jgi:protein-tyrosine kinase
MIPGRVIAPMGKDEVFEAALIIGQEQDFASGPGESTAPSSSSEEIKTTGSDDVAHRDAEKPATAELPSLKEEHLIDLCADNGTSLNEPHDVKNPRNNVVEILPTLSDSQSAPEINTRRVSGITHTVSPDRRASNRATTPAASKTDAREPDKAGKVEAKALPKDSRQKIDIVPNQDKPLIINADDPVAIEAFSILRSRLLKACEPDKRAILITSAEQGEGKTVVAVNLALSLAQLGQKRILLVDSDLRVCGVTHMLDVYNRYGLADFLRSEQPLESVIHPTNIRNLSVVPAGQDPTKSLPEVLEGARWSEFIAAAKKHFDMIVVDSLPFTAPVVDLELLMAPCDNFVLTIQIGKTRRTNIRRVAQWMDKQKLLGIVVNNADKLKDGSYSSSYYGRPSNGARK